MTHRDSPDGRVRAGDAWETTQIYEGTNQIQRVVISKRLRSEDLRVLGWTERDPASRRGARASGTADRS